MADCAPKPETWTVVSGSEAVVVVAAECECHHPDCGWTASVYSDRFICAR